MDNRSRGHLAWRVSNVERREADVDIFDIIGGDGFWEDGIKGSDFAKELRALDVDRINLHINSPGGYVDDAIHMYTAIQQHPAEVFAYVESVAASAASFVAMAADRVIIAKNAKIFIHDAHGFAFGNAAAMRAISALLDEESDNIASIYAEKTGKDAAEWREAMQANSGIGTTYRGQEAVDAGLADELAAAPARNALLGKIAALQRDAVTRNAGRTMSQGNLDKLHDAMGGLDAFHEGTCDMGDDCPRMEIANKSDSPSVGNEYERRYIAASKGA